MMWSRVMASAHWLKYTEKIHRNDVSTSTCPVRVRETETDTHTLHTERQTGIHTHKRHAHSPRHCATGTCQIEGSRPNALILQAPKSSRFFSHFWHQSSQSRPKFHRTTTREVSLGNNFANLDSTSQPQARVQSRSKT